ncbi:MAG: hypothetical protein OXC60_12385 [Litoreibacter sp.]|nr:hypothetical protein [Litoreibacter sp.]
MGALIGADMYGGNRVRCTQSLCLSVLGASHRGLVSGSTGSELPVYYAGGLGRLRL